MKIEVYTTIEESARYGDLNSSEVKRFNSIELRDKYFDDVLRPSYTKRSKYLTEYEPNNFYDGGKWTYSISKEKETIEIFDDFTIDDDKLIFKS